MKRYRIVVTGAAGYLGRGVVSALSARGCDVTALVRSTPIPGSLSGQVRSCDLTDRAETLAAIEQARPHAIIHAAAWIGAHRGSDGADRAAAVQDNILATTHIAEAALRSGTPRLIFCSSVEVYGPAPTNGAAHRESDAPQPSNPYGRSKLAAESAVAMLVGSDCTAVVVRMPGIHGAPRRTGAVAAMIAAARTGKPITVAEPDSKLSILWHADAVGALSDLAIQIQPPQPGTLNLSSANIILGGLAQTIAGLCGSTAGCVLGASAPRNRWLDCTLARETLGWAPTELGTALLHEIAAPPP